MPEPPLQGNASHSKQSDWQTAWKEHLSWLRGIVWARVSDPHAVEDVLQEVALAATKGLGQVATEKQAPWLYRTAVRQALLHRRKRGRREKYAASNEAILEEVHDPQAHDPLAFLLLRERDAMVRRGLKALPSRDREMLVLKYTQALSYREIANRLGVSESTVESRLHRARRHLRQTLSELDPSLAESVRKESVSSASN